MTATYEMQDELNRRVDDLRAYEREYRYRLRAFVTEHLDSLNDYDPREGSRQELIGPEWTLIGAGLEVRVVGVEPAGRDGLQRRAIIEIRQVPE